MNYLTMQLANINLGDGKVTVETISEEDFRKFLGGNGIAIKVLSERLVPGTDPFSPQNILFFGNGPLTGTGVQGSDRICVASKSPLTGLFFDSTMGGRFASSLQQTGYAALAITGKAKRPSYLLISSEGIEVRDAGRLVGKSPEEVRNTLSTKHKNAEVCAIGVAGENLVRYAAIVHPRANGRAGVAGRGGLGAVMGSKNLKAIIVQRGSEGKKVDIHSPSLLKEIMSRTQDRLKEKIPHFTTIGTASGVKDINNLGGFGTRNLREEVFESASNIDGDTLRDKYYRKNTACFSCPVACGKLCEIDGKLVKNPEYESIYALGSMVGVGDLEAVIRANTICDEYGLDTMSMGITIAFAIECFEKGYLSPEQTDNRIFNFGNAVLVADLIRATALKEGIGVMLAEGTRRMSALLGGDAWHYAHQVKGLELAGHSARMVKTLSIGYATNTRGGSHQDARVRYGPGMDTYEGKVELAILTQNMSSVGDSLVMCRFLMENGLGREFNDEYSILLEAITGWKPNAKELTEVGERIVNLERIFNIREGVNREDDTLPYKVMMEEIPSGPHKGFGTPPEKLQEMLQNYYALRGWDENGIPKQETLKRLDLL